MKYIIRGKDSGVFYGEIKERTNSEITIKNVRQIWAWYGAHDLFQLSLEGSKRPDDCKITMTVSEITITDCIEIIPCSEKCMECLDSIKEWKM